MALLVNVPMTLLCEALSRDYDVVVHLRHKTDHSGDLDFLAVGVDGSHEGLEHSFAAGLESLRAAIAAGDTDLWRISLAEFRAFIEVPENLGWHRAFLRLENRFADIARELEAPEDPEEHQEVRASVDS